MTAVHKSGSEFHRATRSVSGMEAFYETLSSLTAFTAVFNAGIWRFHCEKTGVSSCR